MEKITKEALEDFVQRTKIELIPTQPKLCVPIINRICKKMSASIKFSEIKVEKGMICDGHHRYLASLLAGVSIERIPSAVTSSTDLIDWGSIIFVNDDWDTDAKIDMLNRIDADYNDIPLEKILELLK